jgi:hypothetical protein
MNSQKKFDISWQLDLYVRSCAMAERPGNFRNGSLSTEARPPACAAMSVAPRKRKSNQYIGVGLGWSWRLMMLASA